MGQPRDRRRLPHWGASTGAHLAKNARPTISQLDMAAHLEDPAHAQALLAWNINIAASNPQ
ncbi:MAG: hypothetical protein OXG37_10165 [Actinomycetia bacterium]|nr:hypothetical protein [Actinomycetes bacterium]